MDYLVGKCAHTLHLRTEQTDQDTFKVFNGRTDYLFVRRVENDMGIKILSCECRESVKTKLPCIHELCVCIKHNLSIEAQVGKRWTNEEERTEIENMRKMHKKNKWRRTTLS